MKHHFNVSAPRQPSRAATQATQATGEPTAASSTSMTSSTSPATEVTSSAAALGLSADLMDSGAARYPSAKVTNMSVAAATGLESSSSSSSPHILFRLECNSITLSCFFFFFPFHCSSVQINVTASCAAIKLKKKVTTNTIAMELQCPIRPQLDKRISVCPLDGRCPLALS